MPSAGPVLQEVLNAGRNPFQWPVRHAPTCFADFTRDIPGSSAKANTAPLWAIFWRVGADSDRVRPDSAPIRPPSGAGGAPFPEARHRGARDTQLCTPKQTEKARSKGYPPADGASVAGVAELQAGGRVGRDRQAGTPVTPYPAPRSVPAPRGTGTHIPSAPVSGQFSPGGGAVPPHVVQGDYHEVSQ